MSKTFQEWINSGERIYYHIKEKRILSKEDSSKDTISVFQLITNSIQETKTCITMLSGYPDGSYGWSKVENILASILQVPRLYIEYVGQGDSDKPNDYKYSTLERADLVEANWKHHKIENTFVVAFDYSSLVVLELLRRQQERESNALKPNTNIDKVLFINGGYFADAHSHPYLTTPFLKSKIGKVSTKMVQKSKLLFELYLKMIKNMWSQDYDVSKTEINEFYKAVTNRNGAIFMSNAGGFVMEHKNKFSKRWNLESIYIEMEDFVSFHIVGSNEDIFEPKQFIKVQERLGKYNIDIRKIPGGHFCTIEQPKIIATTISELI